MRVFFTCIIFLFLCTTSCSQKSVYTTQTTSVINEGYGYITLRITGYGKNKGEAIIAAERNAIEQILFRGIPNSKQSIPLVSINEIETKKKYHEYFDKLLNEGRYKTFILSSTPTSDYSKNNQNKKNICVDVKVHLQALRNDLEQQGIIKKFGF